MGLPIYRGKETPPLGFLYRRVSYPTFCFILDVREIFKNKQGHSFERPYNIKHRQKVNPLTQVGGNLGLPGSPRRRQHGSTKFFVEQSFRVALLHFRKAETLPYAFFILQTDKRTNSPIFPPVSSDKLVSPDHPGKKPHPCFWAQGFAGLDSPF